MIMQDEQKSYEEWLSSLKVGDKASFHSRYHGYVIVEVIKITPTKQIKTTSGHGIQTFKEGRCRVDEWTSYSLEPITDTVKETIKRKYFLSKIRDYNFENMTNEQLERVNKITLE